MRFKASHTCPLLCLIIYGLLLTTRNPQIESAVKDGGYLTQIILQFLIFLIPSIIYCRLKGPGYTAKLNFRPVGPAALGVTLLSILLLITGSWLIRMGQLALVMGDTSISFVGTYPISPENPADRVYISLTFAALPAICEEFVFRSVLITEYTTQGYGALTVGYLSSLLFAMMHFDLAQFPVYLWCGAVLVMLTYVSQSVIPAMICHFAYNMYGIFGESYLLQFFSHPQNTIFLLFVLTAVFLIVLVLTLGEAERLYTVYGDCDRETPAYAIERIKQYPKFSDKFLHALPALFSPVFILCIALFVMMTVATRT